jgi:hypothetical protein
MEWLDVSAVLVAVELVEPVPATWMPPDLKVDQAEVPVPRPLAAAAAVAVSPVATLTPVESVVVRPGS